MKKEELDFLKSLSSDHDENHTDPECPVGVALREAVVNHSGPAQVATEDYRRNWTTIFGAKTEVGEA